VSFAALLSSDLREQQHAHPATPQDGRHRRETILVSLMTPRPCPGGLRFKPNTTAHTSPMKQRGDVVTRDARRYWRPEEQREVVLASLRPSAMPMAICLHHGIGSGKLSIWRREFWEAKLGHLTCRF
jgi:hypothetical protein